MFSSEFERWNYWWVVLLVMISSQVFGRDATVFITPSVSASFKRPVGISGDSWKPYATAGLSCAFPSTIDLLCCFASFETGTLHQKNGDVTVQIFDMAFGLQLLTPAAKGFGCSSFASLSSIMAGMRNGRIGIKGLHTFSDVENEYGVTVGVTPSYTWRRFEFRLPLCYERIFSAPDRFTCLGVSLQAGYSVGGAR